jgi:predicted membrane-bound dolichyl-phosphate-mannose-protein mannosyltransferase
MIAIAIAAFFAVLALASMVTIATCMTQGIAAGLAIVAELSGSTVYAKPVRAVALPPLRGRRAVSLPNCSRPAVRLRPLRRAAAA